MCPKKEFCTIYIYIFNYLRILFKDNDSESKLMPLNILEYLKRFSDLN